MGKTGRYRSVGKQFGLALAGTGLVFVLFAQTLQSQDLSNYRWENRLVVLLTPDTGNAEYLRQVEALQRESAALEDRKGLVVTITPDGFGIGLPPGKLEFRKPGKFRGVHPAQGFRLLLIGLDGGKKFESGFFTEPADLWSRIDSMPMRRREIRDGGP